MRIQEIFEGSMGGLNRAAPSTDVSYERMLDEVMSKLALKFSDTGAADERKAKIKEQVSRFASGEVVKHPLLPKNGEVQFTRGNTVIVKSFLDSRLYKFSPMSLKKL